MMYSLLGYIAPGGSINTNTLWTQRGTHLAAESTIVSLLPSAPKKKTFEPQELLPEPPTVANTNIMQKKRNKPW